MECPVCGEPLEDRPERCFRCETRLSPWWAFEGLLAQGEAAPAGVLAPAGGGRSQRVLMAALVGGIALGMSVSLLIRGWESAAGPVPVAAASAAPTPSSSTAPPQTLARAGGPVAPRMTYRAQRGDSLWRIAAAVTGEGHRWRELWPERKHGRLARSEILVIPAIPETE